MALTGDRLQRTLNTYDTALQGAEDATLARIYAALDAGGKLLEQQLTKSYAKNQGVQGLLPNQRALLIREEIAEYMALLKPEQREAIEADFERLLSTASQTGVNLSQELINATTNTNVAPFAVANLEAVRFQAQDAAKRLYRWSDEYQQKISGIVEMHLAVGSGPQKVAATLRSELGIVKGRAEAIARTESISAMDSATRENYKRNEISYVQRIATQDARTCGYCAARAGKVYRLEEAPSALHPRDRCFNSPWKPEWAALGLVDNAWAEKHVADVQAQAQQRGEALNNGPAPFERMNGLQPPKPVWSPGEPLPALPERASAATVNTKTSSKAQTRKLEKGKDINIESFRAEMSEWLAVPGDSDRLTAVKEFADSFLQVLDEDLADFRKTTRILRGEDGKIQALASVYKASGDDDFVIDYLVAAPSAPKGSGSQMLALLEQEAAKKKAARLYVSPAYNSEPFWESQGFAKSGYGWIRPVFTPKTSPANLESLMRVGRGRIQQLGDKPTVQQMQALRSELLKGLPAKTATKLAEKSGITVNAQSAADATGITERLKGGIVATVAEFHQLTGGNVKQDLGFVRTDNRAWADVEERVINVGGEPSREGIFHELGHFLEADNPGLAEAARQWRDAKATGEARPLNEILGTDSYTGERAVPGKFLKPYVGKVYDNGLTEVVSVGMEHMVSPERMQELFDADPDHFAFMIGALEAAKAQRLGASTGQAPKQTGEKLYMDWYDKFLGRTPADVAAIEAKRRAEFQDYLDREAESIRRRTSGEIDRKLREYYDAEARQIRQKLGIPEPEGSVVSDSPDTPDDLQIKSYNRNLKPIAAPELDIDEASLSDSGKAALKVARDYQQVLSEINEAIAKIPGPDKTLPADAYQRIYGSINGLFDRVTGLVDESKALAGKTGNDALDAQLARMSKISKEALPGYEIKPITPELETKAAKRPC